jgi:hypothetical protein
MDPIEPILLGQVYYKLEPLAYLIDNPAVISIIGSNLQVMGKLEVNIMPVSDDGVSELDEDLIPDSPEDLEGARIDFVVEIKQASELPVNFCRDVFCEYTFYLGEEKYATVKVEGKNTEPVFDYRHHHTIEYCSPNFIEYLKKESVRIYVL